MSDPARDPMSPGASLGPYREPAPFASERLVPPPKKARRIAAWLAVSLGLFLLFTLASPWQQNVRGSGRVIAFAPLERRQPVEAPVSGRVAEWFVQEGSRVEEGSPIVRLSDNDPELMERLAIQREATAARLQSYEERVEAQRERLEAETRAQSSAVQSYEARVRSAQQALSAAEQAEQAARAALETAAVNLARRRALQELGLASGREFELATLAEVQARTAHGSSQARVQGARADLSSKQADLDRARADRESAIAGARATLQSAQSDAASARASLAGLDVRISRQRAQLVTAPRAGVIFRVVARQGGEQVSAGDTLAIIVPDTHDRAVELTIDGNDAALISPGRAVRLQFEGWPAVQFTGWPSVAVGTFGGRVAFVDATDDGQGDFRVVIVPDAEDEPWPSPRFLRQGVRANGWVLLNRVSVGFELWRQLNGFPPVFDRPPSTGDGSGGGGYGGGYGGGSYGDEGDGEGYGGGYGDEG